MAHCPQKNELVERAIQTILDQRIHRQGFGTLQHAN